MLLIPRFSRRECELMQSFRHTLHIHWTIAQSLCFSFSSFYWAVKCEFLRIAFSTLWPRNFIPKAKDLVECMKQQGSKHGTTGFCDTKDAKVIVAHPDSF